METEIIAGLALIKLLFRASINSQYSKTKPEEMYTNKLFGEWESTIPGCAQNRFNNTLCVYIHVFLAEKGKIKRRGTIILHRI